MKLVQEKTRKRLRRHQHIRKNLRGTAEKPRLAVFRSVKHIYCQLIDDDHGHTLAAASTGSPELKGQLAKTGDIGAARQVGTLIGQKAIQLGIKALVFDRGGFRYHGRVKALADAAREVFKKAGEAGF